MGKKPKPQVHGRPRSPTMSKKELLVLYFIHKYVAIQFTQTINNNITREMSTFNGTFADDNLDIQEDSKGADGKDGPATASFRNGRPCRGHAAGVTGSITHVCMY